MHASEDLENKYGLIILHKGSDNRKRVSYKNKLGTRSSTELKFWGNADIIKINHELKKLINPHKTEWFSNVPQFHFLPIILG